LANRSSGLTINVRTLVMAALAIGGFGIARDLLQAGVAPAIRDWIEKNQLL
jgi:hypothetical protein